MATDQGLHSGRRAPEVTKSRVPIKASRQHSARRTPSQLKENSNDINNSFIPDGTSKLVQIFNEPKDDDEPLRTLEHRSAQPTWRQPDGAGRKGSLNPHVSN